MNRKSSSESTTEKPEKDRSGLMGVLGLGLVAMVTSLGASFVLAPEPKAATAACDTETVHAEVASGLTSADQAYVELPELLITIGNAPATRYLKMNVAIVTTQDGVDTVESSRLALTDAFTTYLRAVELSDFEDPAFYGHLRDQLLRRSELVLGASVADGLLITEFLLR